MSSEVPASLRNEQLLLAHIMRFPDKAKPIVFCYLRPDRFIYGRHGGWGSDHRIVYQAMERVMSENRLPSLTEVVTELGGDGEGLRPYLSSLLTRLSEHFRVNAFDEAYVRRLVERVDAAGYVYQIMSDSQAVSGPLRTVMDFDRELDNIEDPDGWAADVIGRLSRAGRVTDGSYVPVSRVVEETRKLLEEQRRGTQQFVLPTGFPSLSRSGLWLPGSLTVVHGASSSGKSLFVHTLDLGVALGLVRYGLNGCVAINSIEMTRSKPVLRWVSMLTGVHYQTLTRRIMQLKDEDYARLQKWLDFVAGLPIVIDDSHFLCFSEMRYAVTALHNSDRGPVRQVSVDYLELFNGDSRGKDDGPGTEELRLSSIVRELQNLAHEYDIHVVVISQTTYLLGTKVTIAGPGATRYSRGIQHAADVIIEIFNPQALANASIEYQLPPGMDADCFWVIVEKNRDGAVGTRIPFEWQPECFRVLDPVLKDRGGVGAGGRLLFEHLGSVQEMRRVSPSAMFVDIDDTVLGDLV